jgi:hypothetical protein
METDIVGLGAWVRLAAADCSGALMSYPEYDQWRKHRLEAAAANARPLEAIPSSAKLRSAVGGSWYSVKVLAGVPGAEAVAAARRNRRGYAPEAVTAAVEAAMVACVELGSRPAALRASDYVRWRAAELNRSRTAGQDCSLPSIDVVRRVLGGSDRLWKAVLRTVLAAPNVTFVRVSQPTGTAES